MDTTNSDDLSNKLDLHRKWVHSEGGERARLVGADLTSTHLTGAELTGADLTGANLTGADLTGANLTGANLTGALLTGATLTGARLINARLTDADLTSASLTGANLAGVRLTGARGWHKAVKDDIHLVLSWASAEAPAVLTALEQGRVDGGNYSGECACLVGTIAQARGVQPHSLPKRGQGAGLACDPTSLAETFFMCIRRGDTPDNSTECALAAGWVREFINRAAHPPVDRSTKPELERQLADLREFAGETDELVDVLGVQGVEALKAATLDAVAEVEDELADQPPRRGN